MRRKGRALNGLLVLDKPTGISSNLALQKVKRLFDAAKAGHTGSLDPLATGMLVICFGKATKISKYLLNADKQYEVTALLGTTTDTGDADGAVLETRDASSITDEAIVYAIQELTGAIEQIPPMVSAIKHQGTRLYKLARQGVEVERQSRKVNIYAFELQAREGARLRMHVHCSKGTYIRSLIEDLGSKLGCGAHVVELRRTSIGPFINSKMNSLPEMQSLHEEQPLMLDALILPADIALEAFPAIRIDNELMHEMRNGHPIWVKEAPPNGLVRLYNENDEFYGVGRVLEDGRIAPKSLN